MSKAVRIIKFQCVVYPGALKNLVTVIWGLGDDNKMYQWDSKDKKWVN